MDELCSDLALLLAERAIERTLLRYCRGIDRLLPDLVRACFHPDATDDHGTGARPVEEFITWAFDLAATYRMTTHQLTNVLIDVDPALTVALAESYGVAHHQGPDDQPWDARRNLVTGFRFIDRFECRDGRWAIARRVATTEWVTVDHPEQRWAVPDPMRRGARDGTDPIHWLVPEVAGA